jgi:hypothetical protein
MSPIFVRRGDSIVDFNEIAHGAVYVRREKRTMDNAAKVPRDQRPFPSNLRAGRTQRVRKYRQFLPNPGYALLPVGERMPYIYESR